MNLRQKGTYYEEAVIAHLKAHGVSVTGKNVRCGRIGEIDIIGKTDKPETLIFFEVKYRKDHRYGYPVQAVDAKKREKIRRCAEYYLAYNPVNCLIRFDVIAIEGEEIIWYENAF